ncbi:ABC transporter substrate-binding protein [Glycomyces harbinensis]|uniref:Multiple sugar transport system substrate-binding protein n=2 Tax=Glycomyces harbinensis TaxID=58114 RepID=A0A1G6UBZ1_9ACTN|nr:extracellular solute-binding protein [Glycomyces harbinensis]SDD38226.1 multiple sugar transport system substrate-binding protein [Glycomyces harbinensis]
MISCSARRASLAVMAAGALALTACSGGGDDGDGTGSITFGNWQWLETGRGEAMWDAATAFEDAEPDIRLEKSETPFAQYADKLNTELGAGAGPDVFVVLDRQFATLAEAGLLEPLDDAVADADLNATNDNLNIDGEQLAVTWEQVSYALLGNANVLEEAGIEQMPTTVEELIAAGEQAEAAGFDGFAVRHQMNEYNGWAYDFPSWTYGYGGSWSDGENLTVDSAENIAGVSAYKEVFDAGIVPVGDDASTFRSKFKENQLAMIIDNSGTALSLTSDSQLTGQDLVSAPLPFPDPGAHQKLVLAVNANSDNKEAAKQFVSWAVSEEGQATLRPSLGASVLATDVPIDAEFAAANPWAETFVELGATNRSGLPAGFETEADPIMRAVLEQVERVITEDLDPAEAMRNAQAALEAD